MLEARSHPRLRALGLRVERRGNAVLDDLSLDVAQGEAVSISGSSGCGKSTLLRALALLDRLAGGRIEIDGIDAESIEYRAYRRKVSLVFQEPPMFEGTVADNVRFGPTLAGKSLSDDDVVRLLALVALDPSMGKRDAERLSGGERQRVALARAIANDPALLLLDEPTSALDPNAAQAVIRQIRRLSAQGLAVVAVLHVPEHARLLGDRHLHMRDGKLVAEGLPA